MKHLEKYEDFAYHSDLFEEGDNSSHAENMKNSSFLNAEYQKRKREKNKNPDWYKTYKIVAQNKPIYQATTKEIQRLL